MAADPLHSPDTATTVQDQDRGRWDQAQITEGLSLVRTTPRRGNPGQYRLQAAIAAVHREAAHPAETDWPQIVALYAEL